MRWLFAYDRISYLGLGRCEGLIDHLSHGLRGQAFAAFCDEVLRKAIEDGSVVGGAIGPIFPALGLVTRIEAVTLLSPASDHVGKSREEQSVITAARIRTSLPRQLFRCYD